MMAAPSSRSGAVVIGRNEGDRLRACIESVLPSFRTTVYVDSGSTDGSIPLARSMEVEVVELDMDRPFTAARARNAGFERLKEIKPELAYVQFVDGDCEIVPAGRRRQRQRSNRTRRRQSCAGGAGSASGKRRSTIACATWNGILRWARPDRVGVTPS